MPTVCDPLAARYSPPSPGGDLEVDVAALTAARRTAGVVVTGTAELLDNQPISAGLVSVDQPMLSAARWTG